MSNNAFVFGYIPTPHNKALHEEFQCMGLHCVIKFIIIINMPSSYCLQFNVFLDFPNMKSKGEAPLTPQAVMGRPDEVMDCQHWWVERPLAPAEHGTAHYPISEQLCLPQDGSVWCQATKSARVWDDGLYRSQTPCHEGGANGWAPLDFALNGGFVPCCTDSTLSFFLNNQRCKHVLSKQCSTD